MKNSIFEVYGYIYKITNLINQKVYIGQTVYDIQKRFRGHIASSYKKEHRKKTYISRAIKKYGEINFVCELITCASSKSELNFLEKFYIRYYNSFYYTGLGYNVAEGGYGGATNNNKVLYTNGIVSIFIDVGDIPPVGFIKGSCSSPNKGKSWKWYNDGEKEYWINPDVSIPSHLIKGRIKGKMKPMTNGIITKYIPINDKPPIGWREGRHVKTTKDKIWINKDGVNKMISKEEYIFFYSDWSFGTSKGNKALTYIKKNIAWNCNKKFKWITNGVISKQIAYDKPIPDGFWKGRHNNGRKKQ